MVMDRTAPDILQKYGYSEYLTGVGDERAFKLLDFVCDNFGHTSDARLPSDHSLAAVIKRAEEQDMKTNCRGLSLILSELLRMNGIRARHVTCKPYEEPFSDCHVVVDCLLPSGARVMLDPTYRLYLKDDKGEYVSLEGLREGILRAESFRPNSGASYNGTGFDLDGYIEYMTKNVLRFNTNRKPGGTDSVFSEIELVPGGYTTKGYPWMIRYTTDPVYFWRIG